MKFKIIEDKRTLKAMEKRGLIGQHEYSEFPQVDADLGQFVYKDKTVIFITGVFFTTRRKFTIFFNEIN